MWLFILDMIKGKKVQKLYNVAKFEMMNKNNSPYVVIIEKR